MKSTKVHEIWLPLKMLCSWDSCASGRETIEHRLLFQFLKATWCKNSYTCPTNSIGYWEKGNLFKEFEDLTEPNNDDGTKIATA